MWVDAVEILSVWETGLDCTIIHLLGWRARAKNAEFSRKYSICHSPNSLLNYQFSHVFNGKVFLQKKYSFLYLSPQQIFKRRLKKKDHRYLIVWNITVDFWFILHLICLPQNSPLLIFEWIPLYFLPLGYRKPSMFASEPYIHSHKHTLLKSKFIFIQNI